jgi:enamine deaminase RidA (YjgF/YER057c/UK114 family)
MDTTRTGALRRIADELGFDLGAELRIGGIYTPVVVHGDTAWVSGQVPRIGDSVVAVGRVPDQASLELAKQGARVAALRTLVLLDRSAGGLDRVAQVLRLGVFVHSAPDFGGHSEIGDAASEVLYAVLGSEAGRHARTSVGVAQLPKGAAVEVELVAALHPGAPHAR